MLAVQMKVDKDCLSCLVKQEENKSHAGKKDPYRWRPNITSYQCF